MNNTKNDSFDSENYHINSKNNNDNSISDQINQELFSNYVGHVLFGRE